ncbi:hypothetical protein BpHYR1_008579 [Brachionus plicatilis]|uniref:Uncharacterized protein n=1 Tax=Brachionus plicatilis TaxID=10195 RepID=A0A3M7QX41_BRAPC|nr:hypothetical protein BpHYR1_008579 [Brachionus plicatilis]
MTPHTINSINFNNNKKNIIEATKASAACLVIFCPLQLLLSIARAPNSSSLSLTEQPYNLKLTRTFFFLDSSSTIQVGKGKVEEESKKSRGKEIYGLKKKSSMMNKKIN